jgi:hypothetical protein
MRIFLEVIIWLVITKIFIDVHYHIIVRKKQTPNHAQSFLICLILACVLTGLTFYKELNEWNYIVLLNIPYLGFIYWLLFNIGLNLMRKKELLYVGKDSVLDRFENNVGPIYMAHIKLVWIIVLTFVLADI